MAVVTLTRVSVHNECSRSAFCGDDERGWGGMRGEMHGGEDAVMERPGVAAGRSRTGSWSVWYVNAPLNPCDMISIRSLDLGRQFLLHPRVCAFFSRLRGFGGKEFLLGLLPDGEHRVLDCRSHTAVDITHASPDGLPSSPPPTW